MLLSWHPWLSSDLIVALLLGFSFQRLSLPESSRAKLSRRARLSSKRKVLHWKMSEKKISFLGLQLLIVGLVLSLPHHNTYIGVRGWLCASKSHFGLDHR